MEARQSVRQTLKDLMYGSSIAVDQFYKLGEDGKDLDVKPTREAYSFEFNKEEISFAPKIIIKLNLISFSEMLLIALMVDKDQSKIFSECSFVPLNSFLHLLISNDALKKWDICLECPYGFKGWKNTEKFKMEKKQEFEDDSELFFDSVTGTYFRASRDYISRALILLNDTWNLYGVLDIDEYIAKLGIEPDHQIDSNLKWREYPNFRLIYDTTKISKPNYLTIIADSLSKEDVEKKQDPILSIWYDYLMCSDSHLYVCYNNGTEKDLHHHNYAVKGKTWTDQVFEIAKYLYTFMDGVFDDVYGESAFTPDMISRNAVWMALDVVDHERQEIQYNMNDPEEYDRITDF